MVLHLHLKPSGNLTVDGEISVQSVLCNEIYEVFEEIHARIVDKVNGIGLKFLNP